MNALRLVEQIRDGPLTKWFVDCKHPHRLTVDEGPEKFASYCFGVPILREDGSLVNPFFFEDGAEFCSLGSDTAVSLCQGKIELKSGEGRAEIIFPFPFCPALASDGSLRGEGIKIMPTFNGVAVELSALILPPDRVFTCRLECSKSHYEVLCNENSFSLMEEQYRPFLTLTPILGKTSSEKCLPIHVHCTTQNNGRCHNLTFEKIPSGGTILFECNLHTPKLVLDSTVESKNIEKNNAFGSAAHIGFGEFGEQQLMGRIETSLIRDLREYSIERAMLFVPLFSTAEVPLRIDRINQWWCGFGINWRKRVESSDLISRGERYGDFVTFDLTQVVCELLKRDVLRDSGFVIRAEGQDGFVTLATGDSFDRPQILEMKYHI